MGNAENRFWNDIRQVLSLKLSSWSKKLTLLNKSVHRKMENTKQSSRSRMIWLRQGRRSNRISKMSVRSVSRKGKSEMTLNDDRFSGERK